MLKIYFDEQLIDGKYIRSLTQEASSFDSQFKLGSTICRAFELELDKRANLTTTNPSKVYIKNGTEGTTEDDVIYATLYVDDLDNENGAYYKYSLVDEMVKLNKEFVYDAETSRSVKTLVEMICANHNISLVTQTFYMDDLMVSWGQDGMTERDFVSYVAEVNNGYAYINSDGNLVIQSYVKTPQKTIDVKDCSSFKLGSYHLIDRVYVELASATHYYPDTTENETVYLNSSNILLTDSGSYTIEGIVQHIQEAITGLNFYNIKVDRCPIDSDILCGNLIAFELDDNSYNTIAQIELAFNGSWYGGYELELKSASQQETTVKSSNVEAKIKSLSIVVDRDKGRIDEILSDASGHTGSFAMYLNENDPDSVVSCINASADSIILNTKSLIFGTYPDGQYIEARDYKKQVAGYYDGVRQSSSGYYTNLFTPVSGTKYIYEIEFTTPDTIVSQTSQCLYGSVQSATQTTYRIFCLYLTKSSTDYILHYNATSNSSGGQETKVFTTNLSVGTRYKTRFDETTRMMTLYDENGTVLESIKYPYSLYVDLPSLSWPLFSGISANDSSIFETGLFQGTIHAFNIYNDSDEIIYNFKPYFDGTSNVLKEVKASTAYTENGSLEYIDGTFASVGVLFDGTGDIYMQPEGIWDISNFENDIMYNQFQMTHSVEEGTGNQIYFGNRDLNGNVANIQRLGANRNFDSSYGYANSFTQQNFCYADTTNLANLINFLSITSDSEKSKYSSSNRMFIQNCKYADSSLGNSISLLTTSTQTSLVTSNYKYDTKTYANSFSMSNSSTINQAIINNAKFSENLMANSITLSSAGTYDLSRFSNYFLNSNILANTLLLYAGSSSNYLELINNNFDTSYRANQISLKCYSNMNNFSILNFASSATDDNQFGNCIYMGSKAVGSDNDRYIEIQNRDNANPQTISNEIIMRKNDTINFIHLYCNSSSQIRGQIFISALTDNYWEVKDRSGYTHNLYLTTRDSDGNIKDGLYLNYKQLYFSNGYVRYYT